MCIRDRSKENAENTEKSSKSNNKISFPNTSRVTTGLLVILVIVSLIQSYRMSHLAAVETPYPDFVFDAPESAQATSTLQWSPVFKRSSKEVLNSYRLDNHDVDVFYAYFNGGDGELVSSLHRLYQQDRWTLTERDKVSINGMPMLLDKVSSSIGIKRSIYYFYIVDGKWTVSRREAKLQEVIMTLQGVQSQGAIIAISFIEDEQQEIDHTKVLERVESFVTASFIGQ